LRAPLFEMSELSQKLLLQQGRMSWLLAMKTDHRGRYSDCKSNS